MEYEARNKNQKKTNKKNEEEESESHFESESQTLLKSLESKNQFSYCKDLFPTRDFTSFSLQNTFEKHQKQPLCSAILSPIEKTTNMSKKMSHSELAPNEIPANPPAPAFTEYRESNEVALSKLLVD